MTSKSVILPVFAIATMVANTGFLKSQNKIKGAFHHIARKEIK